MISEPEFFLLLWIAIPPDLKNVVAAASLGHRGDTAFSHFKSPCSLFPYPFRKFFFRWAQDKPMSPDVNGRN